MSTVSAFSFTIEQLFSELEKDELEVDADTIDQARKGNGNALWSIGAEYDDEKREYEKAMAWYRLAAVKNYSKAQNSIGCLYHNGEGVPCDDMIALEWFITAAIQNNEMAWGNIGVLFEEGEGVPVDKYMALEWYHKHEDNSDEIKELEEQGFQLTEENKNKPIEQLIIETEDMILAAKGKIIGELKDEIQKLKSKNTLMQEAINDKDSKISLLKENMESYRLALEKKQLEIDTLLKAKNKREEEFRAEVDSLQKSKIQIEKESATRIKSLEEENKTHQLSLEHALKQLKVKLDEESDVKHHKMKSPEKDNQTYQVLPEQKQQQIDILSAVKNERENQLIEEINVLKQSKEESTAKIKSLKKENLNYRLTAEYYQSEINDQREEIEQFKINNEKMTSEIQLLKVANGIQIAQLEVKDNHITSLENIIISLGPTSKRLTENTVHSIAELKNSNRYLERLLRQEQQSRDNEIELIKQMIQNLLSKAQGENHKSEAFA